MLTHIVLFALLACGDNFASVQSADTIEAYEEYLAANPGSRWEMQANDRLETLYLDKASKEKSLEAYDAYLERFPEGKLRSRALGEREGFLFDWAKHEGTEASWTKFLAEYPKADKARKKEAERMVEVYAYLGKVTLSDTRAKPVNLAEDPKGPMDGWGFEVDVTNNGDEVITDMRLMIQYLSEEGGVLDQKEWPVVAPKFPVPIEEEKKIPMQPGEMRTWWWTDAMPEKWAEGKTRVKVTRIQRAPKE